MIYTSYFAKHKKNAEPDIAYISIAVGNPKYPVEYDIVDLNVLKPFGIFRKYSGDAFKEKYFELLDRYGVPRIRREIERAKGQHETALLMCHEKDKNDCHRSMFAEWWLLRTGERIDEYGEEIKKPTERIEQLSMFG